MSTLRSSIRNRDEGYQDDFVMIGIDTYGDGRYIVSLGANTEGNQLDLKFHSANTLDSYPRFTALCYGFSGRCSWIFYNKNKCIQC